MKYWEIENINANTFVGNEIKRFDVKSYGNVIVTNDKWATGNWSTRVGATEKTKAEAQAILDDRRTTVIANWDNTVNVMTLEGETVEVGTRNINTQPERVVLP